jgi:hypothetical protein
LIVDAVASVFPFGSDRFIRLREMFRLTMFREAAEAGQSIIFTFAPEATVAPDFPDLARKTVEHFGGELIAIRLTLPVDEQERRVANADRSKFGKLHSVELLRQLRQQFIVCEAAMPPAAMWEKLSSVRPLRVKATSTEAERGRKTEIAMRLYRPNRRCPPLYSQAEQGTGQVRCTHCGVLHRKNALFYTLNCAEVGDLFMSLIHICELNGANSFQYLTKLQRQKSIGQTVAVTLSDFTHACRKLTQFDTGNPGPLSW